MHYYKRNIGDYYKKAGRLTILQHGVYTLLLDACYDRETFPTRDEAVEWVWACSDEEIAAVEFCLKRFFTLGDDGRYTHDQVAEDMSQYREFCDKQAENGRKGGRPKNNPAETQQNPVGFSENPAGTQQEPSGEENKPKKSLTNNQEPLTTNQEPKEKNTAEPDGSESSVQQVFEYWRFVMDRHNAKLTPTRRRKITARLKMFSVDEIKLAIDGCRRSKFHMGENDTGTIYDDIELICRNDEKIEKFQMVGTGSQEPDYSGFYGLRI